MAMSGLFLGWDVGAWNCDRNRKSRDTICALMVRDSVPVAIGKAWRGNLRDILVMHEESSLISALLERVDAPANEDLTIAIDTPLAWPQRMIELLTRGAVVEVPPNADKNPYLFRTQELALFMRGCRPLSTVRDMIGSQSTKGIHFLRRGQFEPSAVGVWNRRSTVAIETYPAAAVLDVEVAQLASQLFADFLGREQQQRNKAWQEDVQDAIICALIAWLYRQHPQRLERPSDAADPTEGWIWLPTSTLGAERRLP